jgi:hypothetical protein
LQQEIADLGTIIVGNDEPVVAGDRCDLADGNPEIFELFGNGSFLIFTPDCWAVSSATYIIKKDLSDCLQLIHILSIELIFPARL